MILVAFLVACAAEAAPRHRAIAFSPADPSVMYFGLEVVEPNGP